MDFTYKKTDMVYNNYKWITTSGDDKLTGQPNAVFFDKHEGFEVLYIINNLQLESKKICRDAEELIHDELPENIKTQREVSSWLEKQVGLIDLDE